MIADLSELGPMRPGESRYIACHLHSQAFDRLDFDDAWERAYSCPDCRADFDGRTA